MIHLAAPAAGGALDSAGLGDAPPGGVSQTCRIERSAGGGGGQVNQEIIPDSHWLTLCVRIILVAAKEFRSRLPQILLSRY